MTEPGTADARVDESRRGTGRARGVLYAVLLATIAGVCCFHRLSEGTLLGDEAAFACTTDRMRDTGDWVVPYLGGLPHLNATPLYNWLTLAVRTGDDESPLWHRFWSAAFGVGCVLLTFVLGMRLFNPEVGLLAGLLLVFNRDFLFCHGVRFGGMDAMLAFFVTAAALCHARLREGTGRSLAVWAVLGACVGLAWLSKPPAFGTCFFGLIVVQHVWSRRGEGWRVWAVGPLVALVVGVAVAAPWYALVWGRLGTEGIHKLFVYNSVGRALDPVARDFLCCVNATSHSSGGFKLVFPALAAAIVCWLVGERRREWGLLVALAGGFMLALTVAGRAGNYIFYVFPMLGVLVAAALLDVGPRLAAHRPGLRRLLLIAGVLVAGAALVADGTKTLRTLIQPAWVHPPVAIYDRLASDLEQGRCRLALVKFPHADDTDAYKVGINAEDLYYADRMPLADRLREPQELRALVASGKPVIVVLPVLPARLDQLSILPADLRPVFFVEENRWRQYLYPVLVFNRLPEGLTADELTFLARGSQR